MVWHMRSALYWCIAADTLSALLTIYLDINFWPTRRSTGWLDVFSVGTRNAFPEHSSWALA